MGLTVSKLWRFAEDFSKRATGNPLGVMPVLIASVPVSWLLSRLLPSPNGSVLFDNDEADGKRLRRSRREQAGFALRVVAATGLSAGLLALPVSLPKQSAQTMMSTVLCGLFAITTFKSLAYPDVQPDPPMDVRASPLRWLANDLGDYCLPFVRIVVPLRAGASRKPTAELVRQAAYCALVAAVKLACLPVLRTQAFRLALAEQPSAAQRYCVRPLLWCAQIVAGSWMFDLLEGAVPLLSMGRVASVPFHNDILLSASVSEFWAYRYNNFMSDYLRANVHHPLRYRRVGPDTAAAATFAVSGLLHAYVAANVFAKGALSSLLYFVAHAAAVAVDRRYLLRVAKPARLAFLLAVLAATFPLYPRLFLDAGTTWLENEAPPPAWTYRVASRLLPSCVDVTF